MSARVNLVGLEEDQAIALLLHAKARSRGLGGPLLCLFDCGAARSLLIYSGVGGLGNAVVGGWFLG